jgi:hypothetical protein
MAKRKRTNKDLQDMHIKLKIEYAHDLSMKDNSISFVNTKGSTII